MLWEFLVPPSQMGQATRTVVEARDYQLTFADGTKAIDLTSGLWNVNFGYGNPFVAERIEKVIRECHYATLFRSSHPAAHEVAERLLAHLDMSEAALVFSTSGSALNDVMVKLALQWNSLLGRRARTVVSIQGSYHGMTLNSMKLSGENLGQAVYGAHSTNFVHLPVDDTDAWKQFFQVRGNTVALVVLEPVLGSGAIPLSNDVLNVIFEARKQYGFLIGADEVAMGLYRLGTIAASFDWKESADLLGFSKALTNGTAASSVLVVSNTVAEVFIQQDSVFMHGETQAGSPVACAAILGVLDFLDSANIQEQYHQLESRVSLDLEHLARKYHLSRRGMGLFQYLGWGDADSFESDALSGSLGADYFRSRGISIQPSLEGIQIIPAITMPISIWDEAVRNLHAAFEELTTRGTK